LLNQVMSLGLFSEGHRQTARNFENFRMVRVIMLNQYLEDKY